MKANEKMKAQKVLDKIQGGNFDENDIDNIFMRLRAYSGGFRVFREAADFVAHNDARNKGLVNEALEALHLSFKFYASYGHMNRPLDLSKPAPIYIKKMLKLHVYRFKAEELREKFNVTQTRLESWIDNLFKDDKKSKTTMLQHHALSEVKLAAIQHLIGFNTYPAFTADELMRELIAVLRLNKLNFDERAVLEQQPNIVLCVMLLMHQSTYDFGDGAMGECMITAECPSVTLGFPADFGAPGFGDLQVSGMVRADVGGRSIGLAFAVFSSGLRVSELCDESLFSVKVLSEVQNLYTKNVDLSGDLFLLNSGKIGKSSPL
ncbi:hypothetical protein LOY67_17595 [Pseudomonas sp. B21-056]|jgi:hypothetical protein|uniref:hypothetical protein n=1 Tax=Pseudomonas sp. B21-056 TaxID=2895495 RepID=UPI00222FC016|nr:hypothetical protein [Pseudomonas sp. B21-056]UZE21861.1 hypothetical protein LOY67_17595 [Pseudomonas sp. B21-056]